MELKIKNRNLISLTQFLGQVPLVGTESRERTKFIQECAPHLEELDGRRRELAASYAEKDEDGNPVLIEGDNGTQFDLSEESQAKFDADMKKILDEEFTLGVEVGNLTKLRTVKKIILETDLKLGGQLAFEYDAWCEAMESLDLS